MPIRDWAQRQGLVGSPDRPMSWRQRLDWIIPGNVYRHNEGTGWSRNDLIGAGVQMHTGLPVAGLVTRLLGGNRGAGPAAPDLAGSRLGQLLAQGGIGPVGNIDGLTMRPTLPNVMQRSEELGLPQPGDVAERMVIDPVTGRLVPADRDVVGTPGSGMQLPGGGSGRSGSWQRGLGLGIRGDALGQAIEEMSARQHSRGGLLQER